MTQTADSNQLCSLADPGLNLSLVTVTEWTGSVSSLFQQIINCSAILLAVWNPELKKLYDRNVTRPSFPLIVNFRERLGTRLVM